MNTEKLFKLSLSGRWGIQSVCVWESIPSWKEWVYKISTVLKHKISLKDMKQEIYIGTIRKKDL